MMDLVPAKSAEITEITENDGQLFLRSDAGCLRIMPLPMAAVRISFTENDFSDEQGSLLSWSRLPDIPYTDADESIYIPIGSAILVIRKKNGQVLAANELGDVLFVTDSKEPYTLEAFDSYKTVQNGDLQIEKTQTADGVKSRIVGRETVFDETLYHTRINFTFQNGEHLIGLGQMEEGGFDHRKTTQFLHQANRKIAIPFFISSKGYGFLSTTESPAIFNDTQFGSYFRTEADHYLDFVLFFGTPASIMKSYRNLSGRASLLPRYAYGYVQSMERYESQEELLSVANEFELRKLPLDLLVLDWMSWEGNQWGQKKFDVKRFPDPGAMVRKLHEGHVHFMMSIWPNMGEGTENRIEMEETGCIFPGTEAYDAFSEKGREIYDKQLGELKRHGVDGWWCDSSEPLTPEWAKKVTPDASTMYHDFVTEASKCMPIKKANAYGYYHAMGMYEGLRKSTPDKRVLNLTRNGYVGSQKHGTILWSGDTSASWKTLRQQIGAGIQFTASGHPWWTLDIGAFFVKKAAAWFWDGDYPMGIEDPLYRELYVRWFEYGAFLPVFRAHGTDIRREPWAFGEPGTPVFEALKETLALRYRLMPYIYSEAASAVFEGKSLMRHLGFDFPEDEKAWTAEYQYMFGDAMMICPITEPIKDFTKIETSLNTESKSLQKVTDSVQKVPADSTQSASADSAELLSYRTVYFPAGESWVDFHTGEVYEGGTTAEVSAPLSYIPIFVKQGSIIPMTTPALHTETQIGSDIELVIYPGKDACFTLYEDAGDGYGYENGEYTETIIRYAENTKEVTIETNGDLRFRKGTLFSTINNYCHE